MLYSFAKNLIIILLFVSQSSLGQTQFQASELTRKSKKIKKQKPQLEVSTKVIKPITVNFNDYSHLALVTINNLNSSSKGWYDIYQERLSGSPLKILNPFYINKKKAIYDREFLKKIENPKYLYLEYYRSNGSEKDPLETKLTKVIVRDFKNNILYSVEHTNVSMEETLSPFINF
tara:strand:+ start:12620 stop:13144 length:525 start_codon:yes stop_codon:yes gene_type:complete